MEIGITPASALLIISPRCPRVAGVINKPLTIPAWPEHFWRVQIGPARRPRIPQGGHFGKALAGLLRGSRGGRPLRLLWTSSRRALSTITLGISRRMV